MGFKELVRFNEAMLAKQIWRLHTDKESLLYKVFSTKYFPSGSVFEARSSRGSFAWQSLLKARHIIKKGMLWRVGDGRQIRVFHDNWIPGSFSTSAVPRTPDLVDDSTVSSLINQSTREWDVQQIDLLIAPFMAQKIKAIPLCNLMWSDCIVWPRTRDGEYSVKTGYQLLVESDNRGEASGSSSDNLRSFWKGIWKMRVPNKIKNFC